MCPGQMLRRPPCYSRRNKVNVDSVMPDGPTTQTITSASDQRKSVPVVTVESFFNTHGEKLALRLEGPRVGFYRKIREPTINRPGLASQWVLQLFRRETGSGARRGREYLSEKSVAEIAGETLPRLVRTKNSVRGDLAGRHISTTHLMAVAAEEEIAIFRTPMITMKFINAATIALEVDFSPTVTEFGSMVDILGIGVLIRGVKRHRQKRMRAGIDRTRIQPGGRRCDADHFVGRARIDGDGAGTDALSHGSARHRDHQCCLGLWHRQLSGWRNGSIWW